MKNIYFVGAPTLEKGLEDYNTLAKEFKNARFYWFCFKLDTKIKKRFSLINFKVGLNDAQLQTEINNNMNYFVSCSKFEGFCLPIAEAMRLKKPVLTYSLEEITAEFHNNIEYVDNIKQMKKRLHKLLDADDYKKDLSKAKSFIEFTFSPKIVSERLLKIII